MAYFPMRERGNEKKFYLKSLQAKSFHDFSVPKQRIFEQTFGWFNHSRRVSKDYETLPESSETLIVIAMIRIMLVRLK